MKWFYVTALSLVAFLVIGGFIVVTGKQPEPFPEGTQSAALLQPGSLAIANYEETFIDSSRPTEANGDFAGEPERRLQGMVWHPQNRDAGPFPLVIYSHGFTSTWQGGAYLADQLARLGYVVVAVDYPLTNFAAPGGPNPKDVVNQPADISFIIDTLLEHSTNEGHALEGMIDSARIGVTGISLGGLTTTLVSFHPEMRDPRIGAALSIAGPTAIFTDKFFSFAQVPFLMLAGDIDALVPYDSNAAPVIAKVPGAQLISLAGGSHTGFAGPAAPLRWLDNPDAIGCYMVKSNVDESVADPWFELIGTPEQGIDYNAANELCLMDPLPPAMNVLRQQMISSLVVTSFFQSIFAPSAAQREQSARFLSDIIANELAEVSYAKYSNELTQKSG